MWIWLSTDRSPAAIIWSGRPELEMRPAVACDAGWVEALPRRRPAALPARPRINRVAGVRAGGEIATDWRPVVRLYRRRPETHRLAPDGLDASRWSARSDQSDRSDQSEQSDQSDPGEWSE